VSGDELMEFGSRCGEFLVSLLFMPLICLGVGSDIPFISGLCNTLVVFLLIVGTVTLSVLLLAASVHSSEYLDQAEPWQILSAASTFALSGYLLFLSSSWVFLSFYSVIQVGFIGVFSYSYLMNRGENT
jgi:hypothetical protein